MAEAVNAPGARIQITADFTVSSTVQIGPGGNIVISSVDGQRTITFTGTGSLFSIPSTASNVLIGEQLTVSLPDRSVFAVKAESGASNIRIDGLEVTGGRLYTGSGVSNLAITNCINTLGEITNSVWNTFLSSSWCGPNIDVSGCTNVVVSGNTVSGATIGILLNGTTNASVCGNDVRLIGNVDAFGGGNNVPNGHGVTIGGVGGIGAWTSSAAQTSTNVLAYSNYINGAGDVGLGFEGHILNCGAYKNEVSNASSGNFFITGVDDNVVFDTNYEMMDGGYGMPNFGTIHSAGVTSQRASKRTATWPRIPAK